VSKHNVKIQLDQLGSGTVEVDGTDLADALRGIKVSAEPGSPAQVTLNLGVIELHSLDLEQAEIIVPGEVREALIVLGWTPPDYDHLIGQRVEVVNRAGLTKRGELESIGEGYMALRLDDDRRAYVALEDVTSAKPAPQAA
jgi:hypothetical protein